MQKPTTTCCHCYCLWCCCCCVAVAFSADLQIFIAILHMNATELGALLYVYFDCYYNFSWLNSFVCHIQLFQLVEFTLNYTHVCVCVVLFALSLPFVLSLFIHIVMHATVNEQQHHQLISCWCLIALSFAKAKHTTSISFFFFYYYFATIYRCTIWQIYRF